MSYWKLLRDKVNDEATGAYPLSSRLRVPARQRLPTVPRCAPTTRLGDPEPVGPN